MRRLVIVPMYAPVWKCLLIAAMLTLAFGCDRAAPPAQATSGTLPSPTQPDDRQVLILAAASTQDALNHLAQALQAQGGPELVISPAGSNMLAQQIFAGAPGDLSLSANQAWADHVIKEGYAVQSVALLAGRLVMVVPQNNPANIQSPADLAGNPSRRLVLAGENVPAGIYAQQALRAMGLYDRLLDAGQIVRGQNVRYTLAYVERSEVDAGIVYASDAQASTAVRVVYTFSPQDHEAIVYPLVWLEHGRDRQAVRQAFEFLTSPEAMAIFNQYGFTQAPSPGQ